MKRKRRQRVLSILMALLMIVGLIPTDFAVSTAKAAEVAVTTTEQDLANGLKAINVGDAIGTVNVTGTSMGIIETGALGGFATAGVATTTYVYFPVTGLTGDFKISADVTVNKFTAATPATTQGVFMGVTNAIGGSSTSPFVSVAMRGDYKYNMYRQKADGTCGGSAGTTLYTAGTKSNLSIERRTAENKYYTTVDSVALKNSSDISTTLNAASYSGYVFIAVNGADVTINNFKILNGDGTVVYDQATYAPPTSGTKATISNVNVSKTDNNVTVTWDEANGSGDAKTLVEYSTDGTTWNPVSTVALGTKSATQDLTALSSGTYSYRVTGDSTPVVAATTISWVQPRMVWTSVGNPSATATQSNSDINVAWDMNLGADGADSLKIDLLDSANTVVGTKTIDKTATTVTSGVATFAGISTSGIYTVNLTATRADETTAKSGTTTISYALALTEPTVVSATSDGKGGVALSWDSVKEANSYTVSYKKASDVDYTVSATGISTTSYTVSGLTVDTDYTFKITAVRVNPAATKDSLYDKKVTSTVERVWKIGYVGTQAGDNKSGGEVKVNTDGSVDMFAPAGKFATSNDGYEFYYTEVEAAKENFTLTATFNLATIKDNQSGVGLLVADTLGKPGEFELASATNYYLAGISKTEWTTDGVKTTYSCGTNIRKVTGCTDPAGQDATGRTVDITNAFQTDLTPEQVINTANLAAGTCQNTFTFTLTKDNNGYYATMVGSDKVIHMYDASKLLKQDGDKVYVGLAVSRGTQAKFTNITFESRDPASDPAKDESTWDKEYTPQNLYVFAGSSTGTSDYTYRYYGNWAGQLELTDGNGTVLYSKYVEAGETVVYNMQLAKGTTKLITTVTPDPNKVVLKSYDPIVIEKSVTYKTVGNEGETIVVSADATSSGKGTDASPMDIYSAVKYAQPGQVIYLKNGTYNLTTPVTIQYSVSGTADKMITLMAEDAGQVILDGSQIPEGSSSILNVNGNYWRVYGLDIRNSSKNTKGIGISGNNNIIELCTIHDNGTTGLQISRAGGEPKEWWPSNNLVKNCTAYNNCDPLLNDADGFAAKLTVGEGNKFYGCIAYNNVDDGWDLYAKNEIGQGPIGAVVIENSIAYNNGYVPGIGYGEGNGFKLGGEGLPGAHQLINSVSYNNGGKGIASNNGPDCQVINCTSFNNNYYYATGAVTKTSASANIALTPLNGSKYNGVTNYVLKNTISIYTLANGTADQLTVIGQAPLESENNYLVTSAFKSLNSKGIEATVDWFTSVDTSIVPTREANGTINMHGLFAVKSEYASLGLGASIVTTGDAALSVAPVKTTVITPQTGDMTHIYLFMTLSVMSGAALVGLYYYDRKKKTIVKR